VTIKHNWKAILIMCQLFRHMRLLSDLYFCVCTYLYYCTSLIINNKNNNNNNDKVMPVLNSVEASEATATWRFTNFVLYCIVLNQFYHCLLGSERM